MINSSSAKSDHLLTQSALVAPLSERLGKNVGVACEIVTDETGLLEGEDAPLAQAVPKRRAEFAAGRRAARAALGKIGAPEVAIPVGEARAPIWPDPIIGSITHDHGLALAIVAKTRDFKALGIDVTQAAALPGNTRRSILHAPEESALDDLGARAVFAIKECLFKTLYPSVGAFFGFDAAVAQPDFAGQKFTVTLTADLGPFQKNAGFTGTLLNTQGVIVAALALPCCEG